MSFRRHNSSLWHRSNTLYGQGRHHRTARLLIVTTHRSSVQEKIFFTYPRSESLKLVSSTGLGVVFVSGRLDIDRDVAAAQCVIKGSDLALGKARIVLDDRGVFASIP